MLKAFQVSTSVWRRTDLVDDFTIRWFLTNYVKVAGSLMVTKNTPVWRSLQVELAWFRSVAKDVVSLVKVPKNFLQNSTRISIEISIRKNEVQMKQKTTKKCYKLVWWVGGLVIKVEMFNRKKCRFFKVVRPLQDLVDMLSLL